MRKILYAVVDALTHHPPPQDTQSVFRSYIAYFYLHNAQKPTRKRWSCRHFIKSM